MRNPYFLRPETPLHVLETKPDHRCFHEMWAMVRPSSTKEILNFPFITKAKVFSDYLGLDTKKLNSQQRVFLSLLASKNDNLAADATNDVSC